MPPPASPRTVVRFPDMTKASRKDLFLLGAGFSKAVSSHMPLLNELSSAISFFAQTERSVDDIETNFEKVLTFLAERQPWLSEAENLRNRATFLEISGKISRALASMQNKALSEDMPRWLQGLLLRWRQDETWVITLNYDTLIEKAYTELRLRGNEPQLSAIMAHRGLYPFPVESVLSRTQLLLGHEENVGFKLLKLHGSLNWVYSGSDASGETIYDLGIPTGWNAKPLEQHVLVNAIDKVPLVIPTYPREVVVLRERNGPKRVATGTPSASTCRERLLPRLFLSGDGSQHGRAPTTISQEGWNSLGSEP